MIKVGTLLEQIQQLGSITEDQNEFLYRVDKKQIDDFSKHLQTYIHTPDWTESGLGDEVPKGWEKTKGLFVGDTLKSVAPYVVRVSFVVTKDKIFYETKDKAEIENAQPWLSTFNKEDFTHLEAAGEYFSENPPKPVSQKQITDTIKFLSKWYDVSFVDSVETVSKELDKKGDDYNMEIID